jgi:hypothetical protein
MLAREFMVGLYEWERVVNGVSGPEWCKEVRIVIND